MCEPEFEDEESAGGNPSSAIEDLEALRTMATYMRGELMRLGSGGFWLVASLPKLLEEEISAVRAGRPLLATDAKRALS